MFKEIRNKITFFNTITLVAFLILFIAIIILIIKWSLAVSGETYLKDAADQIISNSERTNTNHFFNTTFHSELGYDYIIWNKNLGIVQQSINNRELIEEAYDLTESDQKDNQFISFNSSTGDYRIYKTNFTDTNKEYTLFVFQNISAENEVITYFITYLLIFGILGIICLIPIAFILAGRSLISVKKSYEEQKKFISDASHELRSPLNVIQTSVDVLSFKGNETINANRKWINNISSECQNMSTLINDLTDLAKSDNNQLEFTDRNISLSQLTDEVVFLLDSTAEEKNIILDADIDENLEYFADSDKIRQLLRIFIDNAIKYSPEMSIVKVKLYQDKSQIIFSVKDSGIGISEEDITKIFDRFYRCDNARSRQVSGTGLGLNIAKNIVDYYKGSINVESKLGRGSEFIISLPLINSMET